MGGYSGRLPQEATQGWAATLEGWRQAIVSKTALLRSVFAVCHWHVHFYDVFLMFFAVAPDPGS